MRMETRSRALASHIPEAGPEPTASGGAVAVRFPCALVVLRDAPQGRCGVLSGAVTRGIALPGCTGTHVKRKGLSASTWEGPGWPRSPPLAGLWSKCGPRGSRWPTLGQATSGVIPCSATEVAAEGEGFEPSEHCCSAVFKISIEVRLTCRGAATEQRVSGFLAP